MNPQFLAQKMFENAALMKLYQDFAMPNPMMAMPNPFMPIPNPAVTQNLQSSVMAYQAMFLKTRAIKLMQMKNFQLQSVHNECKVKQESMIPMVKVESPVSASISASASVSEKNIFPSNQSSLLSFTQDIKFAKIESDSNTKTTLVPESVAPGEPINYDTYFKTELEKILHFILTNMGKNNQVEIQNARNAYINNPCLLQIYDKLVMKYYSAKKCKEDIVRYILRKAFKVMRTALIKNEKVCAKKASVLLCKRYFGANLERIEKAGINVEDEDQLIEFFMPYRKKSKNKTMNTNFVLEVFSSEDFCQEYQRFLADFSDILADDNNKKTKKLISFMTDCAKNNNLSKLGGFNRLPWLDVWIEDTKNIAIALMPNKRLIYNCKKNKN